MAAQPDIQQLITSALTGIAAVGNQNGNSIVTLNNSPILVFTGIVDMNQTIATALATAVTGVSEARAADAVPSASPAPAAAPVAAEKKQEVDRRAAPEDRFDSADGAALAAVAAGNQNGNSVVTLNNSPILVFTGIVDMNQTIATALATAVTGVSSSQ